MQRPDLATLRRIARLAEGDGVELSACCDYVERLEAENERLRAQLTGHAVALDAAQREQDTLERQAQQAQRRADDAEDELALARDDDEPRRSGATCAPGRHRIEAVPRENNLRAVRGA